VKRVRTLENVLWLVRHGESTWNEQQLVQGQDDRSTLNAAGRHQARLVANRLRGHPISTIVASDLRRAQETAEAIARVHHLPVLLDPRLRERSFGSCEGLPLSSVSPELSGIDGDRVVDANARPPGGESISDLFVRVVAALDEIATDYPRGETVVVAHGGSIRMMLARAAGHGPTDLLWQPVPNAAVMQLRLPLLAPAQPVPEVPMECEVIA
jgi:2,3-bisphosphoglycerate-dependent phosphoglycerate mutase